MSKKVLWGTVNYKTEHYLPWKLKMAYEFEDPNDFDFIIVDNSPIHNKVFFDELKEKYPNLIVMPYVPQNTTRTSGEHAQGLNLILEYAKKNNYKYILVNDPDFFWVQKDLLKYFIDEMQINNYCCIGAPYTIPLRNFDYNTPCAFGSIYLVDFLTDISFSTSLNTHELLIEGKDVGWEIRQKLSQTKAKHLTFAQNDVREQERIGGNYSYECILREYFLYGRRIAYHLHRGSFDAPLQKFMENNWRSDRSKDLNSAPMNWVQIREAYCNKYYFELSKSSGY